MNPQLSEFRIYTMVDSDKTSYRIICFPAKTEGRHFILDHHILLGTRGEAALRLGNPSSYLAGNKRRGSPQIGESVIISCWEQEERQPSDWGIRHHILLGTRGEAALRLGNPSSYLAGNKRRGSPQIGESVIISCWEQEERQPSDWGIRHHILLGTRGEAALRLGNPSSYLAGNKRRGSPQIGESVIISCWEQEERQPSDWGIRHHILLGTRGEAALRLGNPSSKAASRTSSSRLAKMNDSSFCMDKEDTLWG